MEEKDKVIKKEETRRVRLSREQVLYHGKFKCSISVLKYKGRGGRIDLL